MNQSLPLLKATSACLLASLLAATTLSATDVIAATAYEYYSNPNGYNKCVADSNRINIDSVTNYACRKATAMAQNACASWIGPVGDSTSNIINAGSATSGSIPIKIWGMCTYNDNFSSMMQILYHSDGDSITCAGGNCNFKRTGNWGASSIGSKDATLDIAKFIDHAPTTVIGGETYYYRKIILKRQYGGNTSQDEDSSYVYLKISGITPPAPTLSTCSSTNWPDPAGYTNSNANEGTTSVDIRIRNTANRFNAHPYGDWNDGVIFAMPTDTVAWHTCYYPGIQTTADTEVSSVNFDNWSNYESPLPDDVCLSSSSSRRSVTYEKLQNAVKEPTIGHDWQNFYTLGEADNGGATTGNLTGQSASIGATTVLESDNGRPTTVDDVGKTFTETADTGEPVYAKISSAGYGDTTVEYSCPCCTHGPDADGKYYDDDGDECSPSSDTNDCAGGCCTNTYSSELKNASVTWDNPPDSASVKIPYNYTKRTGINLYENIVYAGENTKIQSVWTMLIPRWNDKTKAAYTTKTGSDTEIKLYAYVTPNPNGDRSGFEVADGDGCSAIRTTNKQCTDLDTDYAMLNSSGKLDGDDDQFFENNIYNVFDASAGDYLCFVSSVSKEATRDDDEDMLDEGNGKWAYSEPACAIIAKRPSFEVWGSDMYSVSDINAVPATKRNVYNGYHNIPSITFAKTGGGSTIYGSWVEESLVLGGTASTNNLASGASTGLNNSEEKAYAGANGGDFCANRSPLTIANHNSTGCHVESSGINYNLDNDARRKLISYWIKTPSTTTIVTPTGVTVDYSNYSADTTISATTISKHITKIIEVDGDLTISGDIVYDGHYTAGSSVDSLREIPKLLIYADNVNIECAVENLDAVIITKVGGSVDTCSNASGIDDPIRSHQLKIFGMVMSDNITLGRTYGQAAWQGGAAPNGQKEPAEIFDFDSSILLWSEFMAGSAETDTFSTIYQTELAPRY